MFVPPRSTRIMYLCRVVAGMGGQGKSGTGTTGREPRDRSYDTKCGGAATCAMRSTAHRRPGCRACIANAPRGHRRGPWRSQGRQASSSRPAITWRGDSGPKPNSGTVGRRSSPSASPWRTPGAAAPSRWRRVRDTSAEQGRCGQGCQAPGRDRSPWRPGRSAARGSLRPCRCRPAANDGDPIVREQCSATSAG